MLHAPLTHNARAMLHDPVTHCALSVLHEPGTPSAFSVLHDPVTASAFGVLHESVTHCAFGALHEPVTPCAFGVLRKPVTRCALGVLLQNPVNTMAFTMVQTLLLAPLVTLVSDGTAFCVSPLRFKPFLFLAVLQIVLVTLLILCGPAVHANLFHLYTFEFSFRWKLETLGLWTIFMYIVAMGIVGRVLAMRSKRGIQPAPAAAASITINEH